MATLRIEEAKGNVKAHTWIPLVLKRLKTDAGKSLGAMLMKTHTDSWWFDAGDAWFIDRKTEHKQWSAVVKTK